MFFFFFFLKKVLRILFCECKRLKKKKSVKGILRPKCLENPWPWLGLKGLNSGCKENEAFSSHFSLYTCYVPPISRSVVTDSLWPHWLWTTRYLCPWNSPGKNTGVGCHSLLQIFPIQGSNPGIEPRSPTLWADSLPSKPPRKSLFFLVEANSTPMVWIRKQHSRKEARVSGCSFVLCDGCSHFFWGLSCEVIVIQSHFW